MNALTSDILPCGTTLVSFISFSRVQIATQMEILFQGRLHNQQGTFFLGSEAKPHDDNVHKTQSHSNYQTQVTTPQITTLPYKLDSIEPFLHTLTLLVLSLFKVLSCLLANVDLEVLKGT